MPVALAIPSLEFWLGLVAIGAAAVLAEIGLRRLARRPFPRRARNGRQPSITARSAQNFYARMVYVVVPATVAGAIAGIRVEDFWLGLLVFACVALTSLALWPRNSPLHLMPVARFLLRVGLPALGIALAAIPAAIGNSKLGWDALLPALLCTWLVIAFGSWLESSFDRDRPIRMAVIGSRELALKLATEMRQMDIRGFVIVGHLGPEPEIEPDVDAEHVLPWLGELEEVREIVQIIGIDLLAVGPDEPRLQVFEHVANACLDLPVRMMEASAFYEDVLGHVPIGQINSAWFQSIMHPRYSPTSPLSKRLLDLAVSLPIAVIALPIIPVLALIVKLADGGPAFFHQTRVGEQGREFEIVKLRTMRPDAAELAGMVPKEELLTPVGRFLRKTHLDELPQLWNVIVGDMTLVGPRPEQPKLVEQLEQVVPYYARRSLVKPGVTGWAQVRCGYAGTQVGTAWKICHDLYYVKRRSILFDLLIILQTLHVIGERADVELETPAEDFILGEAASLVSR